MAIKVTQEVFDGLEAVREFGATNMFDQEAVIELAKSIGFDETAEWVQTHKREYATGIFQGFEV